MRNWVVWPTFEDDDDLLAGMVFYFATIDIRIRIEYISGFLCLPRINLSQSSSRQEKE